MTSGYTPLWKRILIRCLSFLFKVCHAGNFHWFRDRLCFCGEHTHTKDWHGGIYDFKTKSEYHRREGTEIQHAMNMLKISFQSDPDYAHSWHCNLAMAFQDAMPGLDHAIVNDGASRFMKLAFDVETSADPK